MRSEIFRKKKTKKEEEKKPWKLVQEEENRISGRTNSPNRMDVGLLEIIGRCGL